MKTFFKLNIIKSYKKLVSKRAEFENLKAWITNRLDFKRSEITYNIEDVLHWNEPPPPTI